MKLEQGDLFAEVFDPLYFDDFQHAFLEALGKSDNAQWAALVDPCASDDLLPGLYRCHENIRPWPLFMNTMNREAVLSGPQLLAVNGARNVAEFLLHQAEHKAVGVFFLHEENTFDSLFQHLQHFVECTFASGKRGIFRFYDPRVMHALLSFRDGYWPHLILPRSVTMVAWEPWRNRMLRLAGKGEPPLPDDPPHVDDALLEHLSRENSAYAVLNNLPEEYAAHMQDLNRAEQFTLVDGVCRDLIGYGYTGVRDLTMAVAAVLEAGENFFKGKNIQAFMNPSLPLMEELLESLTG